MNVRLRHNLTFTAGIFYGNEVRMNTYLLTVHLLTNSTDASSQNVAFERLKFFVYNNIDSTIFINSDLKEKCDQFIATGLKITTMPGDPVDQLIGLMLHNKLNAVMEDRIIIEETEISSVLGENMIYLHCDNENTNIEHCPEWWYTADLTHNDYISVENDKIVAMHPPSAWRDLDLAWPEDQQDSVTGNTVVFADFKPNHDTK